MTYITIFQYDFLRLFTGLDKNNDKINIKSLSFDETLFWQNYPNTFFLNN